MSPYALMVLAGTIGLLPPAIDAIAYRYDREIDLGELAYRVVGVIALVAILVPWW